MSIAKWREVEQIAFQPPQLGKGVRHAMTAYFKDNTTDENDDVAEIREMCADTLMVTATIVRQVDLLALRRGG
jgi:hypothetical protein